MLRFTKPTPRSFFKCYIHNGITLMTRLCLELSHLLEHKFNDNFQNCINPLCSCSIDIESTSHFFLHCPLFNYKRISLQSILSKTDCKLTESKESSFKNTTIGNQLFDLKKNSLILNASVYYILSTERFEETLL